MARTRFADDHGLTARMTLVMLLLGGLFVGLVVVLMYAFSDYAFLIGIAGIAVAFYQWWSSDKVAMKAMRAREVTPEQAPELHGMIDRLCSMADMPKPRVGISEMNVPNAFATGRSPERSVVCVTTGLLGMLSADELEGVLAHELSHVAHRDVLVMTMASSAGIAAGMLTRAVQFGGMGRSRGNSNENRSAFAAMMVALVVSLVVYAISFFLTRLLSRYREMAADRAGAYLTMKPEALGRALQKISGQISVTPAADLRGTGAMNAFFIAPAISGDTFRRATSTHPSLEQRLDQLARIGTELGREH
ncbi:zinc metalloprotease HtpX [Nocardioides yefusunii]|uniref:Protease HtpX homolog n=1 Tax=Nocardioides yefusunii TaxID=2500546 RepID=A0ABW1QV80_9ACTN|nr:zinc metalloprotease HtpX [Nocardioides yefusunii]